MEGRNERGEGKDQGGEGKDQGVMLAHLGHVDRAGLEGFFDEVSRKLIPGAAWGHGLDAFSDTLRGGFGTPQGG